MSEVKHSPGPWSVQTLCYPGAHIRDVDGELVATNVPTRNASVIAAAPELLQEIKNILHETFCASSPVDASPRLNCGCWKCHHARNLVALIAKAEGR